MDDAMEEFETRSRAALRTAADCLATARARVLAAGGAEWRSTWGARFRAELDHAARELRLLEGRIEVV